MADQTNTDLMTEASEYAEEAEKFGKEMEEKCKYNAEGAKACKCD